jgi:hypothetical protein
MRHVLTFALFTCLLSGAAAAAARPRGAGAAGSADRIRPWKADGRYWQYKGKGVLLLGGSKTDHIFLLDGLKEHLDELVAAGGNYVRCTMSQREGAELKAHLRRGDGKFDMDQWNADYWRRFENCLRWCRERDIIIQIEVWDRFDFAQEHWQASPWRPINNVNYTSAEVGLANSYPAPAWRDRQPFFHSLPGMPLYRKPLDAIRRRQESFVAKVLSYSLACGNVLYCMNNETSTPPQWGQYWMRFIRQAAKRAAVEVQVTDMFDDAWKAAKSAKLRQAIDRPDLYPFLDISQVNSRNFNEDHWRQLQWIVAQVAKRPRPLNHTKIYSAGQTKWGSGTPADGIERFWRNLLAGCASVRFHRPGGGIGLNDQAKNCIRAARKVHGLVPLWTLRTRNDLLRDRAADEAYLAARAGEAYVLYFTDGGSVGLDLRGASGTLDMRWVDIAKGELGSKAELRCGTVVTIAAPRKGAWVAVARPRKRGQATFSRSLPRLLALGRRSRRPSLSGRSRTGASPSPPARRVVCSGSPGPGGAARGTRRTRRPTGA